jgi:hypothetical protein
VLFGERLEEAQRRYAALAERQGRLPAVEVKLREVQAELGWHRADKEDELAECDRQLAALAQREQELVVREKATGSDLTAAQLAHDSFLFKLSRLFNNQAEAEHLRKCDGLEAQLKELAGKLVVCRREREGLLAERAALQEPIATREASSATLAAEHQELLAAWTAADQAVDQLYTEVLQRTPEAELAGRLQRLAQGALQPAFFAACAQTYAAALRQAAAAEPVVASAREALAAANAIGATALTELGALVTESFGVQTVPREVQVKLSGTVSFQGEAELFGSSGPSGSARGAGSGTGEYEIDRLAWSPHPELAARTQVVTAAATAAGQRSAELALAEAQALASQAAVADWIRLLRLEVEREPVAGGR